MRSNRSRVLAGALGLAGVVGWTSTASARECTNNDDHQCWGSLSGVSPNFSQVAVGKTHAGAGIACAVMSSQTDDWGGRIWCFVPLGSSGATTRGYGGQEVGPEPFWGPDPEKRVVSLTIQSGGPASPHRVSIVAVRSDRQIFAASTNWPIPEGQDPRLYFVPAYPPTISRAVAVTANNSLIDVLTWDHQLFRRRLQGDWTLEHNVGSVVLASGDASLGYGVALLGTSHLSKEVGFFGVWPAGWSIPTLPGSLPARGSDFQDKGRATPLVLGIGGGSPPRAYAVLQGTCPTGSLTPCIVKSMVDPSNPSGPWTSWAPFATGDISSGSGYTMPWSIQSGSAFRGVQSEVWVIAGAYHLKFWAP
jgi:hypothetical protein